MLVLNKIFNIIDGEELIKDPEKSEIKDKNEYTGIKVLLCYITGCVYAVAGDKEKQEKFFSYAAINGKDLYFAKEAQKYLDELTADI